jgi:hypothetical protein
MIQTSDPTPVYNCFGWAHNRCEDKWFEPHPENEPYDDPEVIPYWPPHIPRDYSLNSFLSLYKSIGYERCETEDTEKGYKKIALLLDKWGEPIHATFQNEEGSWSSKLGKEEDVSHDLLEIITRYRKMYKLIRMEVVFMKRAII